jgi:predicted signal transduction protein with EAL and GGDEF domain
VRRLPTRPEALPAALTAALTATIAVVAVACTLRAPDHALLPARAGAPGLRHHPVLDDFGTGYSSLSYLQRLPVNEVKIDRSFVAGLRGGDQTSIVLVPASSASAPVCGCGSSPRGEDAATLGQLRELGCDVVQGWYTGRPVPAAELTAGLLRTAAIG